MGGFLKDMSIPFIFEEGGPGCTWLWWRKRWPCPGAQLLTVLCRIPLGLPKPETAGSRIGMRRQSLRAEGGGGVGG